MLALVVLGGSAAVVALINRPVWGVMACSSGLHLIRSVSPRDSRSLGQVTSCLLMLPMALASPIHGPEMRWPIGLQYLIRFSSSALPA